MKQIRRTYKNNLSALSFGANVGRIVATTGIITSTIITIIITTITPLG